MKKTCAFTLIGWLCLSQLSAQFSEPQIIASEFPRINTIIADVDQTASKDFVLYNLPYFKWFAYDHPNHVLLPKAFTIDPPIEEVLGLHAVDLDGDGDTDYVAAEPYAKELIWLEQTDEPGSLKPHVLDIHLDLEKWKIRTADIDGNGLLDIVTINYFENRDIKIYFQTAPKSFLRIERLSSDGNSNFPHILDVDHDGDLDVLITSSWNTTHKLIYFENTDGSGKDWYRRNLDLGENLGIGGSIKALQVVDLEQDGLLDYLVLGCNELRWYRELEDGSFEAVVIEEGSYCLFLSTIIDKHPSLEIVDLENDGLLDLLLVYSGEQAVWRFNGENFEKETISDITVEPQILAHNLDGDGPAELLFGAGHWLVAQADPDNGQYSPGSALAPESMKKYLLRDLDADNDLDLLVIDREGLFCLENIDPTTHTFNHIPKYYLSFRDLLPDDLTIPNFAVDFFAEPTLDNDQSLEILLAIKYTQEDRQSVYYLLDHLGDFTFGAPRLAAGPLLRTTLNHLTDLNGDQVLDLVYHSESSARIEAMLNMGNGNFGTPQSLTEESFQPSIIASADLDMDQDMDVFFDDGQLHWIINDANGGGTLYGTDYMPGEAIQLAVADVDRDGDMDFVKANRSRNSVQVLKNNGKGVYDHQERVDRFSNFLLSDLDLDGWEDLVVRGKFYRNRGGRFTTLPSIPFAPPAADLYLNEDIDADGKREIVYYSGGIIYAVQSKLDAPDLVGYVFRDDNQNSIRDDTEIGLQSVKIAIRENEEVLETFSDEDGRFLLYDLPDGDYQITSEALDNWERTTASAIDTEIPLSGNTVLDFGYHPTAEIQAGRIYLNEQLIRCNQPVRLGISVRNTGTIDHDVLIRLRHDSRLSFDDADRETYQVDPDQHTITWRINNLAALQQEQIDLRFLPIGTDQLGTDLSFQAEFLSVSNDDTILLHQAEYTGTILCAYDPNDKQVSPNRPDKTIFPSEQLLYTIRFQNTGNDTAFQVILRDTLDALLDAKTIRPVSSSHPCIMSVEGKVVEFLFQNILLPDSTTNEAASRGYVQFSIEQSEAVVPGDEIKNRAAIFFDLNEPIITNTVRTALTLPSAGQDPFSAPPAFSVYPNPTEGQLVILWKDGIVAEQRYYALTDQWGRILLHKNQSGKRVSIDLGSVPPGMYFLYAYSQERQLLGIRKIIRH